MANYKATSTSFKKGHMPWNKSGVYKNCCYCGNKFYVKFYRIEEAKTCSKKCGYEYRKLTGTAKSKQEKCLFLAQEGKTIREISEITGFPIGSVSSYLNRAKFRKRTKAGESYRSKVKQLRKIYSKCMICDFDRAVEIAHIIPASKGGDLTKENTIGLCPNHHHLFDTKKLTEQEAKKLQLNVPDWKERIFCADKK